MIRRVYIMVLYIFVCEWAANKKYIYIRVKCDLNPKLLAVWTVLFLRCNSSTESGGILYTHTLQCASPSPSTKKQRWSKPKLSSFVKHTLRQHKSAESGSIRHTLQQCGCARLQTRDSNRAQIKKCNFLMKSPISYIKNLTKRQYLFFL